MSHEIDGRTTAEDAPMTRPYRMAARLEAVDSTRERILAAAYELWLERPYDEVTVEAVAKAAGVSRQTVVRQFGTKDELAIAVVDWQRPHEEASRAAEPGDVATAVERLVERYEAMGDANVRVLELEGRVPAIDYLLAQARASHREWIVTTLLGGAPRRVGRHREETILALYAATDVTVWKLLRRDLAQSRATTRAIIHRLVSGVLDGSAPSHETDKEHRS
jgi:AcrR family transcriptional regulator